MSKLNDSTLKILKKYRLDTDMSVFGNENKLYDVVKVMDDMVGNQVSKYVGDSFYFSSTSNKTYSAFRSTSSGSFKTDSFTQQFAEITSKRVYFDGFSLKFLGVVNANPKTIPACEILKNNTFAGYIGIDIETKTINIYSDLQCSQMITVSVNIGDVLVFRSLLFFTNQYFPYSIGGFDFSNIFDFTYERTNIRIPQFTHGNITLPEQLNLLDTSKTVYCNQVEYLSSLSPSFTYQATHDILLVEV